MKINQLTLNILAALLATSCMVDKGEVTVKLPGAKTFKENQIHNATVTNVQIQNDQLIITGNNLNIITDVKTENADKSFMHNFVIETKSQNQIIAKSSSPISLVANSLLKLIISNSYGATTFDISFNLCDSTLNGRALDCTVAANDRDVLSYDATTQTWKPRAVNGLNYLGSFDASSGSAPTAQPSGSYYIISVAGTISGINFEIGDWIVSNGAAYQKIDNSTAITSVFGRTGAVTALEGDYSLDKLLDVDLTVAPVAGKVLKYDGTKWVASDDLSGGGAGSVSSTEISDGSIATVDLANGAVTDAKINDVSAGKISGTLTGTQIGSGVITNSHIAAGAAIDYSKLNIPAGSIPYSQLNITAGEIPQDRINGLSTSLSALIEDSIVDIVTNKAPSQNAVYDALALKADRTNVTQTITTLAVTGLGAPVANSDAANKQYVDTQRDTRVLKTGDTMSGDLTLDTNLRLKGGANYVTVRANAATANYTLSLPTTAGTAGYVLQTDGAGVLSWINPSSTTAGTSTVNSAAITDGSIVDADINASANIAQSKIAGLTTDLANKQPLDSGLTNLAAYNSNGFLVQTADNTFAGRTITGVANRTTVTNGDGSANPIIDINTSLLPSPVTAGHFFKATGANTAAWSALTAGEITTALTYSPVNKAGDTMTGALNLPANGLNIGTTQFAMSGGNIGIGTASPTAKLDVVGNAKISGNVTIGDPTAYYNGLTINSLYGNGGTGFTIDFFSKPFLGSYTGAVALASNSGNNEVYRNAVASTKLELNASGMQLLTAPTGTTGAAITWSEAFRVNQNGNVGIGTTTPQAKLDVSGGIRLGNDASGCSAANAGTMKFTTNKVYYCNSSAWIEFSAANAAVTSTEITDGTISNADVSATANIDSTKLGTGAVTNTEFNYLDGVTSSIQTQFAGKQPLDTGLTNLAAYNTNGILVQTANDTFVGRSIAGTANRITITNADGVAGNPTLNLDTTLLPSPVVGDVGKWLKATAANTSVWTSLASADITTALGFTPINKAGDTITTGTVAFNTLGTLSIGYTPTNATDATSKSYVDNAVATAANQWTHDTGNIYRSTGNVSIGTATPTAKLTLNLGVIGGASTTTLGQHISGDATTSSAFLGTKYSLNNSTANYSGFVRAARTAGTTFLGLEIGSESNHGIRFLTNGNDDTAEKMKILSSGNVGIGVTAPNTKLQVGDLYNNTTDQTGLGISVYGSGSDYGGLTLWDRDGDTGTINDGDTTLYFGDDVGENLRIAFKLSGAAMSEKMRVQSNGNVGINTTAPSEKLEVNGNVKAAAYLYTSDKRLKKNVKTLDDALERILNLRGVSFKWIENEQAEIGFIAQEVEKEEPLLVVTSETTNMKSVKYGNIVALLVEAFKEEHKKIEENQKLLAIMQNGLEKVEKKVSKLEREVASLKDDNQKLQKQNEELKKEIDLIKKHLKLK